jgi:hypothetical protein
METNLSFSCEMEVTDEMAKFFGFNRLPDTPSNKSLVISYPSATARMVDYERYKQRWRKATSLRKSKKYAKILGFSYSADKRCHFNVDKKVVTVPFQEMVKDGDDRILLTL